MKVNCLRAILLERISRLGPDSFRRREAFLPGTKGPWITMGHFDAMYSYSLSTSVAGNEGVFKTMQWDVDRLAEFRDGKTYFHPLYLIPSEGEGDFWEKPAWALGVLRLHLAKTSDMAASCECLRKDLEGYEHANSCRYKIYYTVELSDLVIAVKTDTLEDLLRFSLNLRRFVHIGKIYSYFGVDNGLLSSRAEYTGADRLDLCSMRFAVADAKKAGKLLELVKEKMGPGKDYSITGVDDVAFFWKGRESKALIGLYRALFSPDMSGYDLGGAFSDVTTRVGIESFPTDFDGDPPPEVGEFDGVCRELVAHADRVRTLPRYQGMDWLKPMSELTNTLAYMGRNVVLDSFLFLMVPAVRAFFVGLENDAKKPFTQRGIENCRNFIRNWNHLMELVTRTEGQLSHYPELRPLVYDVPVIMLEYTLSFLDRCSKILQRDDGPQEIQFLLVPQLCRRIQAEELFPATGSRPGLILVQLPYGELYEADSLQICLCHELSHFVGEKHRKREERVVYFTRCAAVLACKLFFHQYDRNLAILIQEELAAMVAEKRKDPRVGDNALMIVEMTKIVTAWVGLLLHDEDAYTRFSEKVFIRGTGEIFLPARRALLAQSQEDYLRLVQETGKMFREVFADVCMLYLLQPGASRYVHLFDDELENRRGKREEEIFCIRMYVCLSACGMGLPAEKTELCKLDGKLRNKEAETDGGFPLSVVKQLLNYAEACYRSLEGADKSGLEELRDSFWNVSSPHMDYDRFQKDISEYRDRVLEEWNGKTPGRKKSAAVPRSGGGVPAP